MVNKAKRKGDTFERQIVELHKTNGISCARTLLATQAGRHNEFDFTITHYGVEWFGEAKKRSNGSGFKSTYKYLQDDGFFSYENGIYLCSFETYIFLAREAVMPTEINTYVSTTPITTPKTIVSWLEKAEVLFCKMNRKDILVFFDNRLIDKLSLDNNSNSDTLV